MTHGFRARGTFASPQAASYQHPTGTTARAGSTRQFQVPGVPSPIYKASMPAEDRLSPLPSEPRPGHYRHYKGREYLVIGVARHSETLEPLVTYQALYGERGLWVRPVAMFLETVSVGGVNVPRFTYIGEATARK